MTEFLCPCCGATMDHPPPMESLVYADIGPRAKRAIEILLKKYPRGIPLRELGDMIYADDPDGGVLDVKNVLAVSLHYANRKLKKYGWRVGARASGTHDGVTLRLIE